MPTLDGLKNRQWMYNSKIYKVLHHTKIEDKIIITAEEGVISIPEEKLKTELSLFLPVSNEKTKPVSRDNSLTRTGDISNTIIVGNSKSMIDTLDEVLKKLNEDPNFIPQAKAIGEIVDLKIKIAKTEIEALKVIKG